MSRFDPSYRGIGEMLSAEFMQAAMRERAERVKAEAEATAPDHEPIGVGYKYEFRVESGIKTSTKGTSRAFGRVVNDSEHAIYVEFGGRNTPAHRTLGRALRKARD